MGATFIKLGHAPATRQILYCLIIQELRDSRNAHPHRPA